MYEFVYVLCIVNVSMIFFILAICVVRNDVEIAWRRTLAVGTRVPTAVCLEQIIGGIEFRLLWLGRQKLVCRLLVAVFWSSVLVWRAAVRCLRAREPRTRKLVYSLL